MKDFRLDASESIFFQREGEKIEQRLYETKYPEYKAAGLIPAIEDVDESDAVYTYRMVDWVGDVDVIGPQSDDLSEVNAYGDELPQVIKNLGNSYSFDIFEIQRSAKVGRPLDFLKAKGARRFHEERIDEYLSLGSTKFGLTGMLKISNTTTFTPSNKAASGTASWGTPEAPVATGEEIALDILGACAKTVDATKETFNRFRVLLPIQKYNLASIKRLGDGSDVTALAFAMASPFVESIEPWYRCDTAGSGSGTRMMVYPYDGEVLAGLVPRKFQQLPVQQRGLKFHTPCISSCGGAICRYPVAVCYADGI